MSLRMILLALVVVRFKCHFRVLVLLCAESIDVAVLAQSSHTEITSTHVIVYYLLKWLCNVLYVINFVLYIEYDVGFSTKTWSVFVCVYLSVCVCAYND